MLGLGLDPPGLGFGVCPDDEDGACRDGVVEEVGLADVEVVVGRVDAVDGGAEVVMEAEAPDGRTDGDTGPPLGAVGVRPDVTVTVVVDVCGTVTVRPSATVAAHASSEASRRCVQESVERAHGARNPGPAVAAAATVTELAARTAAAAATTERRQGPIGRSCLAGPRGSVAGCRRFGRA